MLTGSVKIRNGSCCKTTKSSRFDRWTLNSMCLMFVDIIDMYNVQKNTLKRASQAFWKVQVDLCFFDELLVEATSHLMTNLYF